MARKKRNMTSAELGHHSYQYVKLREQIKRDAIANNTPCYYCGLPFDFNAPVGAPLSFTVDHIVPLAHGGLSTADNLVPAHYACNNAKGDSLARKMVKNPRKATRRW